MSEIKFCKDCNYYIKKDSISFCRYKESFLNLENGEKLFHSACNYRSVYCGDEAKYFEPRKTFLQRLKEWVRC